MTFIEQRCVLK